MADIYAKHDQYREKIYEGNKFIKYESIDKLHYVESSFTLMLLSQDC